MNDVHSSTRRRGAPPAGQRLSREQVLARAEQVLERDGCDGFTLRALARELGVRPTALYNHVADRDDLLQALVDRFLAEFDLDDLGDRPWPDWVHAVATDLHRRMLDQPERTRLLLSRAPGSRAGGVFLRRFLDTLHDAGLDRAIAHQVWHVIMAIVIGMAQMERGRPPDPGSTFDAVLEVALAGIRDVAEHTGYDSVGWPRDDGVTWPHRVGLSKIE